MTSGRGKLSIFLGYATGVGKTHAMLEEAHKLKAQGVDVVIAYIRAGRRKDLTLRLDELESIPGRRMDYRGGLFEEMDTEAVVARRPAVAVVDEFAHSNVPGAAREKRWQDVQALLDAGIDVLTTLNVQSLESLNDQVWQITGVRVRETVPDWVVKQADEVVMVDVTPRALLNRLERGVVYEPERSRLALQSFFKESTLVALRELALRQTAHEVDLRQESPRAAAGERLLIHITAQPSTAALIRRGRRMADFLGAECLAVCVSPTASLEDLPVGEREAVSRHLSFARNLQIEAHVLSGSDVARTLVDFAREQGVTQIYLARGDGRALVRRVVQLAREMQVMIVAERGR